MFFGHPVAADLKAVDDVPQVARETAGDVDDAVQVVGHELQGEEPHLGIVLRYLPPALADAGAQG